MDIERLDLSALNLSGDQLRFERLVGEIRRRAEPELARRALAHSPVGQLAGWIRPAMAAAAMIAVVAGSALVMTERHAGEPLSPFAANGLAALLSGGEWLPDEPLPTVNEIILAFGGEIQ